MTWGNIVLYGIPIGFFIGIIWGGVMAFQQVARENEIPAYDPTKYRS